MRRRLCSTTASPLTDSTNTTLTPLSLGCALTSWPRTPASQCAHVPKQRWRLLEICTTQKVCPRRTSSRRHSSSSEKRTRKRPHLPRHPAGGLHCARRSGRVDRIREPHRQNRVAGRGDGGLDRRPRRDVPAGQIRAETCGQRWHRRGCGRDLPSLPAEIAVREGPKPTFSPKLTFSPSPASAHAATRTQ